jgi:hypothetical protein
MRLIPAPGSQEMQDALNSPYVHKVVDILLQVKGKSFFNLAARFLKDHEQKTNPSFEMKLHALRINQKGRSNATGNSVSPPYVDELISTLEALYEQDEQKVSFQRGAIVELLASELVGLHCNQSELYSNYRFVDRAYSSDQVDVVVFSEQREQIEAYACKINHKSLSSVDCTNLTALANKAGNWYYNINIGAICFEHSALIEQRIKDVLRGIPSSIPLKAYGLDNFLELEKSPF